MRHAAVCRVDGFRRVEDAAITRFAREFDKRPAVADPDLSPVVVPGIVVIEALAKGAGGTFPLFEDRAMTQYRLDTAVTGKLSVLSDSPLANPEIESPVMFIGLFAYLHA